MANELKIPEGEQELVCDCKDGEGNPVNKYHKISEAGEQKDIMVECVVHKETIDGEEVEVGCGRFRKYPNVQE